MPYSTAFCGVETAMVNGGKAPAPRGSVKKDRGSKTGCDDKAKSTGSSPSADSKTAPSTSEKKPTAWDLRVQKLKAAVTEELEEKMRSKYSLRLTGMRLRWRAKHLEMMTQLHRMENMMSDMASKMDSFVSKVEEEVFFANAPGSSPSLSSSSSDEEYDNFISKVTKESQGQDQDKDGADALVHASALEITAEDVKSEPGSPKTKSQ